MVETLFRINTNSARQLLPFVTATNPPWFAKSILSSRSGDTYLPEYDKINSVSNPVK